MCSLFTVQAIAVSHLSQVAVDSSGHTLSVRLLLKRLKKKSHLLAFRICALHPNEQ